MGLMSDKVNSFIVYILGRYNQFVDMIKEYCNVGMQADMRSQWEILNEWAEEQNLEKAIESVHHDYMFITDYGLGNREEWIMELKTQFNTGTYEASDRELLLENETILVWKGTTHIGGTKYRSTVSSLIRDGKIWRTMVNRVPQGD